MRTAVWMFWLLCTACAVAQPAALNVCLISGSFEYNSDTSLEGFKKYLETGCNVQCTLLKATDPSAVMSRGLVAQSLG